MDRIGRKQIMTLGFMLWALLGLLIGGALGPIQRVLDLFVILYGIFNALGEMGPGVATFLCAAESFPTPLRGHYMGFAAAVGKASAAIGTQVFTPIQESFLTVEKGQQGVFLIGAAFAVVGGLIAWFFLPDKEKDLVSEDARFRAYLEAKGFDTSFYGESLVEQTKSTAFTTVKSWEVGMLIGRACRSDWLMQPWLLSPVGSRANNQKVYEPIICFIWQTLRISVPNVLWQHQ